MDQIGHNSDACGIFGSTPASMARLASARGVGVGVSRSGLGKVASSCGGGWLVGFDRLGVRGEEIADGMCASRCVVDTT